MLKYAEKYTFYCPVLVDICLALWRYCSGRSVSASDGSADDENEHNCAKNKKVFSTVYWCVCNC